MRKFLKQLTIFLILVTGIFGVVGLYSQYLVNPPANDFVAAIIKKHKLASSTSSPRILFAGGSNLAFGIDCSKIEKELNIPVVNLGLHAGLGLSFILEELEDVIQPGDIVIISPEHFLSIDGDYRIKKLTASFYPIASNYFHPSLPEEINLYIERSRKNLKTITVRQFFTGARSTTQNISPVYTKNGFNEKGDLISHLEKKEAKSLADIEYISYSYWKGISLLNNFYERHCNKIKILYTFPPYPVTEYVKNKKVLSKYEEDLKHDLKFPLIGTMQDFVYPNNYFFDTVYHLNKEGRIKRTEKIIALLKKL